MRLVSLYMFKFFFKINCVVVLWSIDFLYNLYWFYVYIFFLKIFVIFCEIVEGREGGRVGEKERREGIREDGWRGGKKEGFIYYVLILYLYFILGCFYFLILLY